MDSFDPTEPHAYDVYKQCGECGEWSMYDKRDIHTLADQEKCTYCGSTQLLSQSTISFRTFSPERAKKATSRVKKAADRRRV